ncbi:SIR2 family protein [Candidatus Binatus sp.]|uniref:SIR2 family protein n=1 Tax=Candidatus Binatus sp. TaxID=2811406 RepID=UPI0039C85E8D
MAEANLIRSVWTTNFDALVARAAAGSRVIPLEVGIDCSQRLVRPLRTGELLIVSLHGDYRYDRIKNTPDELRCQEQELQGGFARECQDAPMVVCGYSGRDSSIMQTLLSAVRKQGTGGLYWCVQNEAILRPNVEELILTAREHGREAYIVHTQGFDDLLVRLASHCLAGC